MSNGNLNVQQFLRIYETKLKMQEDGITNPKQEIKNFTRLIVEKLTKLPPNEILVLDDGYILKDTKGNIIVKFPIE